jgi:Domain of unknown function (DUF4397)
MKRLLAGTAAASIVLTGIMLVGQSAHAADTATVSVVHGIPNTPVNVFVNGKDALPDFKPGTVAGPLQLAGGDYDIKIFPASNTGGTGTPVLQTSATLKAGQNVSLVAHLDVNGKPKLTAFSNDTSPIPAGQAGLVVRHTAAAPAVDVRANGVVAFAGLTNPNQGSADLAAGSIKADVVLAGTQTVVLGPAPLNLTAGTRTIVYAIGSASAKTLGLVVQTITGLGAAPAGIPAGTGGLAAGSAGGVPAWGWLLVGAAGLLVVGGLAGSRRTARAES